VSLGACSLPGFMDGRRACARRRAAAPRPPARAGGGHRARRGLGSGDRGGRGGHDRVCHRSPCARDRGRRGPGPRPGSYLVRGVRSVRGSRRPPRHAASTASSRPKGGLSTFRGSSPIRRWYGGRSSRSFVAGVELQRSSPTIVPRASSRGRPGRSTCRAPGGPEVVRVLGLRLAEDRLARGFHLDEDPRAVTGQALPVRM